MIAGKFLVVIFLAIFLLNSSKCHREESKDNDNKENEQDSSKRKGPSKKDYVGNDPKQFEGIVGPDRDNQRLVSLKKKNDDGTSERVIEADHLVQKSVIAQAKKELEKEIKDIEDKNEGKEMSKRKRRKLNGKRKSLKKLTNYEHGAISIMLLFKNHAQTASYGRQPDSKSINLAKMGKIDKLVGQAVKDYKNKFGDKFDESLKRAVGMGVQKGDITKTQAQKILKDNKLTDPLVRTPKDKDDFVLNGHETRRETIGKLTKFIKAKEGRGDLISKAIQTSNHHMVKKINPKTNNPKTNKPKTNNPKTNNPKSNKPKSNNPKRNNPKTNNPKTNDPKRNNPKTNNPKSNNPKSNNPKTNNPKSNNPKRNKH